MRKGELCKDRKIYVDGYGKRGEGDGQKES